MAPKKQTPAAKGGKDAGKADKGGAKGAKGGKGKGQDDGDDGKNAKTKGGQWITPRHILCEKKSKMDQARDKINEQIENAEVKKSPKAIFADVAREMSEDKARQGGLLGKKVKGSMLPQFEDVAYALQLSSEKAIYMGEAKTSEGYHLIIVEDRG